MKTYFPYIIILFSLKTLAQTVSKYIVVDQFGYRTASEKIAVIRDPLTGFDASESFFPSNTYALVDATSNTQVFTANLTSFKSGTEDTSSGDRTWWFDFSSYEVSGTYYVLDINQNLKSFDFVINDNVYEDVLKHAVRTFFYQRAGFAKDAQYAGAKWADGASHLDALQDTQCRKFDTPNDASSERDLSGGWYDAGDYNKYTPWTCAYIIDMISAYNQNPNAWGDDYNLPYSGNGTPDIIDEIKWGLDHLLKLQEPDGSLISVVSLSGASPPSSATGQSLYGGVNTTSTLAAATAYAYGSKLFAELGNTSYGNTLQQSALDAWTWAEANPNVIWENNSVAYNSVGIGAGQQETDAYGRFAHKMRAAIHLFGLTGDAVYKIVIDNNYQDIHLMLWNFAYPFEQENQEALLYYASLPNATSSVASDIKSTYATAMNSTNNFTAFNNEEDPYMAHLDAYVWGSNGTKNRKGLMFTDYVNYTINPANNADALRAAERYIHYIHGVNPLNLCYLSNMYDYGAENSVDEFYHAWFADGTDWDNVLNDLYGPAPGYLVGGPNPNYNWDVCCPSGCSGFVCDITQRDRIMNQPKQKSYDQFNTSWPMNSWEVTENSCGYQMAYIKLLSQFVDVTGSLSVAEFNRNSIEYYPNPFKNEINFKADAPFNFEVYTITGQILTSGSSEGELVLGKSLTNPGIYFVEITSKEKHQTIKIVKQ
ncbi:glycoside hydrolase family 9 protein [Algibacter sp. 2305UL17-15]|uniref:glycoside hydrolase family 9 protein n=1 Tax=Algibacter sp. 2305UL17-15 TaxID=3231268 RepID=UPI003459BE1F